MAGVCPLGLVTWFRMLPKHGTSSEEMTRPPTQPIITKPSPPPHQCR
jgi:hypothetical protein